MDRENTPQLEAFEHSPTHPDTVLESTALRFEKIAEEHFAPLKELLTDPAVMYAWGHTFSDEQVHKWMATQCDYYRADGVGYFAVFEKSTDHFAGQMGLHRFTLGDISGFEVCYMLSPRFWHRGYALEGVGALERYAKEALGVQVLYAQVKHDNLPSAAVAERSGFEKRATFVKHYNGEDMEHVLYMKTL